MSTLDDWITDAAKALGLPAESIPLELRNDLLNITKDVAHGVARVAGPLTTYLLGMAVAGGTPPATALRTLSELVKDRAPADSADSADGAEGVGSG